MVKLSHEEGAPLSIVEQVVQVNEARVTDMGDKVIAACGGSVEGKTIAVLGLTFKPNTDDMRDAPSVPIVKHLQTHGAKVRAFDPVGMDEARKLLADLEWAENAYDTMPGADALVIITEWNEFRALDFDRAMAVMASPVIVDLRNIYDPEEMAAKGFSYYSIGRAARLPLRQVTTKGQAQA